MRIKSPRATYMYIGDNRGPIICDILVNYNALANVTQLDSVVNLMQYIFLQASGFMLAVGATNVSFIVL